MDGSSLKNIPRKIRAKAVEMGMDKVLKFLVVATGAAALGLGTLTIIRILDEWASALMNAF